MAKNLYFVPKTEIVEPEEIMFELVVLVDSDLEILDAFKKFLEKHRYTVATAAGGPEAARELRLRRPDLIVIEPVLADDWGERVLEQYRRTAVGVPVIGVSKRSRSEIHFPYFAYHVKPVSMFSLLETIRTSLQPADAIRK
jgi:DNA-binding response OmpR family regulator